MDAGSAIQGVHGKAAVVAQGAVAGGLGHGTGLDGGVFLKGFAVFVDFVRKARFCHGDHVEPILQHVGNFLNLVGVVAGDDDGALGRDVAGHFAQGFPLLFVQLVNALFAQGQNLVQLAPGEGPALPGALQFHKGPGFVHDEIHIRLGGAVLQIAKIQAGHVVHDARADGGDLMHDGAFFELALLQQLVHRAHQRHEAAGDGGGAGAAVGFQHVAVDGDGALA